MVDCLTPVFFGAIILIVFGIWLNKQGDAVFEKAMKRSDSQSVRQELMAFINHWEKDSGLNFDAQSITQKKIVLGEFVISRFGENGFGKKL